MKYRACIFDLDGTLINSLNDIANAVNRVLNLHNFSSHPIDAYKNFIGDGTLKLIERSLPRRKQNKQMIQICHKTFLEDYGRNWCVETFIYDGIAEMTDALCNRGIRLSILSNKPHEFTLKCVKAYLMQWPFEFIFGHQAEIPKKPDPAGAVLIANQMGIAPSEFLYLGDSSVDMKTACAAGMFPIAALWGFRTKKELIESGAKVLLNHPMELLSVLD